MILHVIWQRWPLFFLTNSVSKPCFWQRNNMLVLLEIFLRPHQFSAFLKICEWGLYICQIYIVFLYNICTISTLRRKQRIQTLFLRCAWSLIPLNLLERIIRSRRDGTIHQAFGEPIKLVTSLNNLGVLSEGSGEIKRNIRVPCTFLFLSNDLNLPHHVLAWTCSSKDFCLLY